MQPQFVIDKQIPMPGARSLGRPRKYPLADMEVGDSFFIAGVSNQKISGSFLANRPKRFSVRTVTENGELGVRVWRVS